MPAVKPQLIEVEDTRPSTANEETMPGRPTEPLPGRPTELGLGGTTEQPERPTEQALPPPMDDAPFESRTGEMSRMQVEELSRRSVQVTSEIATVEKPVDPVDRAVAGELVQPVAQPAAPPIAPPMPIVPEQTLPARMPSPKKKSGGNKGLAITIGVLALGALGAGGWYLYTTMNHKAPEQQLGKVVDKGSAKRAPHAPIDAAIAAVPVDAPHVAAAAVDAGATKVADIDAGAKVADVDAGTKVAAAVDAGAKTVDAGTKVAAAVDAGTPKTNDKTGTQPTKTSDQLQINSKPAGARVFIDGADQGTSPVKLPGSNDRHTMVVLSPGHELYIGEVDGHGVFDIALKQVTPSGGHAGIKVIKCKAKERYYVYVDGNPTGMTCPTERIDTVVGPHTVEVYDIVTDSRRKWDITVKDERLSARVRIDD